MKKSAAEPARQKNAASASVAAASASRPAAAPMSEARRKKLQEELYGAIEGNDKERMLLALKKGADPWLALRAYKQSGVQWAVERRSLACLPALVELGGGRAYPPGHELESTSALDLALEGTTAEACLSQMLACPEGQKAFSELDKSVALDKAIKGGAVNNLARQCALDLSRWMEPSAEQWKTLAPFAIEERNIEILKRAAGHVELAELTEPAGRQGGSSSFAFEPLLALAARCNNRGAIDFLLKRGCDPRQKDAGGNTALMNAAGQARGVELMGPLLPVSDLDAKNTAGLSALRIAMDRGDAPGARALLKAGASPDLRGPEGKTALMRAVEQGWAEMVEFLAPISNLGARSANGETAVEIGLGREAWAGVDALVGFLPPQAACEAVLAMARKKLPRATAALEAQLLMGAMGAQPAPAADKAEGAQPAARPKRRPAL